MKNLIIIGAGGIGSQIADAIEEINKGGKQWNLRGFLDDNEDKQGRDINGYPVLGKIEDAQDFEDCLLVLAVGNSKNYYIRKEVFKKLGIDHKKYARIVHPSATVSRHSTVGYGSVVLAGARVMPNTQIGRHSFVLANAYVGHDNVIQDFVTVTNSASISGMTTIEEGCYIGANSSIIERIVVGKWSLVGLGSVVLKGVPAFSVVVGNPGRVIKIQDCSAFSV
jgi:sugar O-acyltransferase (sialic acid O-acetyltransferase NeuD family)